MHLRSVADKLYGSNDQVWERHRHRYEVNPEKVSDLEKAGLRFVGKDEKGERMEMLELKGMLSFYIFVVFFTLMFQNFKVSIDKAEIQKSSSVIVIY